MCVSLVTLTTYPAASDEIDVQLTVIMIVVAVLLTRVEEEGVNPGVEWIKCDIM